MLVWFWHQCDDGLIEGDSEFLFPDVECPSAEEWVSETWYVCTMEYYLAMKKDDIMPFAATWMDRVK